MDGAISRQLQSQPFLIAGLMEWEIGHLERSHKGRSLCKYYQAAFMANC